MQLVDFDYELPPELIATHPTPRRRDSRLLCLNPSAPEIDDRMFRDLPALLRSGDLLIFNDTRVIRARLHGHKQTGGKVEILLERLLSDTRALVHIKASKALKTGSLILLPDQCTASVQDRKRGLYVVDFSRDPGPYFEEHGEVPLPPYLGRDAESADDIRYQTVYAREDGAVAAPTAGLHFDEEMLAETQSMGVRHCFVTLHVGAGTFQSLRNDDLAQNRLHSERIRVDESVCAAVAETRSSGGRVIAVGTTSVRAVETAAQSGQLEPFDGESNLFILPGYQFKSIDCLLTNFHLPQSSLLMLVTAFAGIERVLAAYDHAVHEKYRFFSYGDAMFIDRMQATDI